MLAAAASLPIRDALRARADKLTEGRPFARVLVLRLIPAALALVVLALSYMKLATGSFNPFIYFQF